MVRGSAIIQVQTQNGASFEVTGVHGADPKRDLAILQVSSAVGQGTIQPTGLSFLVVSNREVLTGERVFAIGSPEGLPGSLSEGLVSAVRDVGGRRVIQTTAAVSPGSSGGPLLDTSGQVVGIVSAQMRNGQNLNFAIPASIIGQVLVAASSAKAAAPSQPAPQADSQAVAAPRSSPESVDELFDRGTAALLKKQYRLASSLFRKVVQMDPSVSGAYFNAALAHMGADESDQAAYVPVNPETAPANDPERAYAQNFLAEYAKTVAEGQSVADAPR